MKAVTRFPVKCAITALLVLVVSVSIFVATPQAAKASPHSWSLSLSATTGNAQANQGVTLTATTNQDVGPTPYGLYILDTTNGYQQDCSSGTSCSWTVAYVGTTHYFIARIGMFDGSQTQAQTGSLGVTWASSYNWSLSLSASTTSAQANQSVTLTANTNYDVGPTPWGLYILDTTNGSQQDCSSGSSCSWTVAYAGTTHYFIARVGMFDGSQTQAQTGSLGVTWAQSYNWTLSLSASTTNAQANQSVTLTATTNQDVGPTPWGLYILDTSSNTQYDCSSGSSCSWTVAYTGTTHYFIARIGMFDGTQTQAQTGSLGVTWASAYNWQLSLSATTTSAQANQAVTLTATTNYDVGPTPWGLYIVDATSGTQFDCSSGTTCSWTVAYTGTTHTFFARIGMFDGTQTQAQTGNLSVSWAASYNWQLSLSASTTNAQANQYVTLTATTNYDVGPTPWGLYIVDATNGTQYDCSSGTSCSWAVAYSGVTHTFFARVGLFDGTQTQAQTGNLSVTWSSTYNWTLNLSASATNVAANQNVTLTATTNQDVGPTPWGLYIIDTTNGTQQDCSSGTSCTWTVAYNGATHYFVARIGMFDGTQTQAQTGSLAVTWGTAYTWSLNLSASATNASANQNVTLTATTNYNVGPTPWGLYIVDATNGAQYNCSSGTTCSWTVAYSGTTHTFFARVGMFDGSQTQAQTGNLAVTWSSSQDWGLNLSASTTSAQPYQNVTLTATTNIDVGPTPWGLYIIDTTNGTQYNCTSGTSCSWTRAYTGATHTFIARVGMFDGTQTQAQTGSLNVTWALSQNFNWTINLSASNPSPQADQSVTLTATTNNDVGPTPWGLYIIDTTNGTQYNCTSGTSCSWTVAYSSAAHNFIARVGMFDGTQTQVQSGAVTVTWSSGQNWTVNLTASATNAQANQNVTLTATTNSNVGPTYWGLYIVDLTDSRQQNCSTGSTCTWTVAYTGTSHIFVARVGRFDGTSTQVQTSPLTVTWQQTPTPQPGQGKILNVPFVSQWDWTDQTGDGNCGPASLTMTLAYYGKISVTHPSYTDPSYLHAVTIVRTGGPAVPNFTDFEANNSQYGFSLTLLSQYGLGETALNPSLNNTEASRLGAITAQIDQGHPVIVSVYNSYGTRIYGNGKIGGMIADHIVVVTGYATDANGNVVTIYINDPLAVIQSTQGWVEDGSEGQGKDFALTADQFTAAANTWAADVGSSSWEAAAVVPA